MCILAFIYGYENCKFILCSNRDERLSRKTKRGSLIENTTTYYPIDIEAGGTWIAFSGLQRRFAVILNFHDFRYAEFYSHALDTSIKSSRGFLPLDFVRDKSNISAKDFANNIPFDAYNGFNMIVGDTEGCYFLSNRHESPIYLPPKVVHGISNGKLTDIWDKVGICKEKIEHCLPTTSKISSIEDARQLTQSLMDVMSDASPLPDPTFGSFSIEAMIKSAIFVSPVIHSDYVFGTRTITIAVLIEQDVAQQCPSEEPQVVKVDSSIAVIPYGDERDMLSCENAFYPQLLITENDLNESTDTWSCKEVLIPFLR